MEQTHWSQTLQTICGALALDPEPFLSLVLLGIGVALLLVLGLLVVLYWPTGRAAAVVWEVLRPLGAVLLLGGGAWGLASLLPPALLQPGAVVLLVGWMLYVCVVWYRTGDPPDLMWWLILAWFLVATARRVVCP